MIIQTEERDEGLEFELKDVLMLLGILATFFIGAWNIFINITNSKNTRLISTISSERVRWINTIRDCFSVYANYLLIIKRKKLYNVEDELNELLLHYNKILLLMNPTEVVAKKIQEFMNLIHKGLNEKTYSEDSFMDDFHKLHYLQQVLLKTEWARIKKETEKGKQLKEVEMDEIFIEVAKDINEKTYNELLKENFDNK